MSQQLNAIELCVVLLFFYSAACLKAADIGFRVYHKHEVANLITEPKKSYEKCFENASMLQYPVHLFPEEESAKVRAKLATNTITEEFIIVNKKSDEADEATFDSLVAMIAKAEKTGWKWGDIIVYREPLFDVLIETQNLHPGPWTDRRLPSPRDMTLIRQRLARAFKEGVVKEEHYRICGLIYSFLNIDDPAKKFINEQLDGLYVELNSRGGKWSNDGNRTTIDQEFENPGHDFVAFGLPGTVDSAHMIAWCLKHDKRAGITTGANVTDPWLLPMFENHFIHLRNLAVDPGNKDFAILIHHNRKPDDGQLVYFPETEKDSVTFHVNALRKMTAK